MNIFFSVAALITLLTITITIMQMTKHWVFAKGNLFVGYRLNVVVYLLYIIMYTILAINDPSQASMLLLNVFNIWAIVMAVMGILRLKKKRAEKEARKKLKNLYPLCPACKERAKQKLIEDDQILEPVPIIIVE